MARTHADKIYDYYPAFLDLCRKKVVVVGGGEIATGKVRGLIPCGPDPLVVIAPEVSDYIREKAIEGALTWIQREYTYGDLEGAYICFAATDDKSANAKVAKEARERNIPVLAVDDIPNCDFIAPAVVRRGRLVIAISTNALSPAIASHVRRKIERDFPPHWAHLLEVAATVRERLGPARFTIDPEEWQRALDDDLKSLVWEGKVDEATELLWSRLASDKVELEARA
ncbi:siroheme synthase [Thermobaculum terrenum ATCC BAA-798]|uniref:precorrin-2 dehydrogenase n=1 Tax=Thermobaculum terrenum (strain ATCC BAA-798 / CCMEE 7001 / YNP1) TaxID=525904 RepID=D1CEZ2_THET1|nr:bifunctional precorrin-2 dehydrogenase/sirohydrochlorin ferrochelatase [Thermobaculum terrenum]ACZ41498.1 siroheme synthase [Thermobaculum terrenum ATCC BAA-798]